MSPKKSSAPRVGPTRNVPTIEDTYASHFAHAISSGIEDLKAKQFNSCGGYELTDCRYEDGLLVVSMQNGEFNKRELKLKPVSFSCPE